MSILDMFAKDFNSQLYNSAKEQVLVEELDYVTNASLDEITLVDIATDPRKNFEIRKVAMQRITSQDLLCVVLVSSLNSENSDGYNLALLTANRVSDSTLVNQCMKSIVLNSYSHYHDLTVQAISKITDVAVIDECTKTLEARGAYGRYFNIVESLFQQGLKILNE